MHVNKLGRRMEKNNIASVGPLRCMGCGVCEVVCPVDCISMCEDDEGFLVPAVAVAHCVSCSRCLRVCPASNDLTLGKSERSVVFRSLDPSTQESSSGGAAYELGKLMIERGGAVVACVLDERGVACHTVMDDVASLSKAQGSKYVQSDARNGYRFCGEMLGKGKEVLFIGTPCQVAAVRALYPDERGLVTCDLICHGVPSPGFWRRELEWQNSKGRLINRERIMFRGSSFSKRTVYSLYCRDLPNKCIPHERDPYYFAFISNASLRECCYQCRFAQDRRVGDLTVGDCASYNLHLDFHPYEPVSCLVANTPLGGAFLERLLASEWADYEELDYDVKKKLNKQLGVPSGRPAIRDSVYTDLRNLEYDSFARKYRAPISFGGILRSVLELVTPVRVRVLIKKILRLASFDR